MIAAVLIPIFAFALAYLAHSRAPQGDKAWLVKLLLAAFAARLFIHVAVIPNLNVFSHGSPRGDSKFYEYIGGLVARIWQHSDFRFISTEDIPEFPEIRQVALVVNMFGVIATLNGGEPSSLAFTVVMAFFAAMTILEVYVASIELGAAQPQARLVAQLLSWTPAFLYHTSDCYKDGLVAYLVTTSMLNGVGLARKFTARRVIVILLASWALWWVRYYMVFVCVLPAVVGMLGLRAKNRMRPIITALAGGAVLLVVLSYTSATDRIAETAMETFDRATAVNVRQWNAAGGSGVEFDDGGQAFGALGPKLIYTVLSPFPWQGGSMALQLGKIEAFIFYFLLYRAWKAGSSMWLKSPATVLMFAAFLIPATLAYATTMANIGLIVRQRVPLVLITGVLAALWVPAGARSRVGAAAGSIPPPASTPPPRLGGRLATRVPTR